GYVGALWRQSGFSGAFRGLYLTTADNGGKSAAGYLQGDTLAGTAYTAYSYDETNRFWEMAAGSTITASTPRATGLDPNQVVVAKNPVAWDFRSTFGASGSVTGSSYSGELLYFVNNGEPLNWGVYDLKLGGSQEGRFSGKPAGAVSWDAKVGGVLSILDPSSQTTVASGYWLASIAGQWNTEGEIIAHLTGGKYLTNTHLGTLQGPFFGLYTETATSDGTKSGTWVGQGIGTYQQEALQLSGSLAVESQAFMYTRYVEGSPTHGWDEASAMRGLLGSTSLPWGASHTFTALGSYDNPNNRGLWRLWTPAGIIATTTADGGALLGEMMGANHGDNKGIGGYATLFVRPDGVDDQNQPRYKAGYLAYNLTSDFYPGLGTTSGSGMWYLAGNRYTFFEEAFTGLTPAELNWESVNYANLVGKMEGALNVNNFSTSRYNLTDRPWGIWSTTIAGGTAVLPSAGWQATAGGYVAFQGRDGYW
ncbi:MAG: hypothetical protein N2Z74_08875, partial [Syntrophales bacterium]|nr:hypothetical protein [Syntrophales bacterium]